MRRSRIVGLGSYVPDWVVKNDDLKQWMDTTDEWIQERTGIRERRWVPFDSDMGASDMGALAAQKALDDAGMKAEDIQLIVFATLSPDYNFPGCAPLLQRKLGVPAGTAALDIRQQCTGFIYGLSVADQFIKTGMYDRVLLVGAERHSSGLDLSTRGRDVSVIFGDGAGAVVLAPAEDESRCVISTHLHADGGQFEDLWVEFPASRFAPRLDHKYLDEGRHFPRMKGKQVFKHAVTKLPETIFEAFAKSGIAPSEMKLLVPHQANLRINQFVAQMMGLPDEKVVNNIQRYGNTTAATIPLAMDEARGEGRFGPGDLLCLAAFGAGFTWGSALVRF